MKTHAIHNMVRVHDKIKCSTICKQLDMKQNIVSGILSQLKHRGLICNENAFWYAKSNPVVDEVKTKLLDIDIDVNNIWNEGYISGLRDYNIINEHELEHLMDWLKQ